MRCKPLSIGILILAASSALCGEPPRAKPFDEYCVVLWTGDSASKDPAHAYDLREKKHLGKTDRITLRLDPWRPSLFALLDGEVPAEGIVEHLLKL